MTAQITEERFAFGKNWQSFVDHALTDDTVARAVRSLQRMLCRESLQGMTFLDIGCGSGLFSLAAVLLGATVTSFDFDADSVAATTKVRERVSDHAGRWTITRGSVLDEEFLASLGKYDIVYSWGVLHHTGSLWRAIDNAAAMVKPGGLLAIAIYNNVERRFGGSRWWWHVKKLYNRSPSPVRNVMVWSYAAILFGRKLAVGRTPWRVLREHKQGSVRGMDFWHDLRDWVGGYPYEYATAGEVFNTIRHKHGYELIYLDTHDGHTCEEFTFRRSL